MMKPCCVIAACIMGAALVMPVATAAAATPVWVIESQTDWSDAAAEESNLVIKDGMAIPVAKNAFFRSKIESFDTKQRARSLTIDQSPVWENWEPVPNIGPSNLQDAPVLLTVGPGNYWMFGRYGGGGKRGFKAEDAALDGFDMPLKTTPFPNQFDAPGGLKKDVGGYHAWQSRDMVNWVHHGNITPSKGKWMTTAEYVDGKAYFYYDFPNDQDPHLIIDDNLFDGVPGKDMGVAFKDPSDGSDCTFIRDLDGNFHVIAEDWSPIDASKHSWDSPLAIHAVSPDGIRNFKILAPPVDERTKPTGRFAEYSHPHWHAEDPANFPGKVVTTDVPQHGIGKGQTRSFATYEIHEPEQNAFGDWAAICIGGRYYLFGDFHPAKGGLRVAWFVSDDIDKPFRRVGEIGNGHPDPDIAFAEGRFYLVTQMNTDYVSPGPWVPTVEARVGVDADKDGMIDQWTEWREVKETYDYIEGFSKQIECTPAALDLSGLPAGYGFCFELRMKDATANASRPVLDSVTMSFGD